MQGKRIDRVGHLIQKELGELILHRVKDPRLGSFVTITHVSPSSDLKSAMVFYTVRGNSGKEEVQAGLEKAAGFFQKQIADALKLRYTPKLKFRFDDSLDRGFEIDRLLYDLQRQEKPSAG
ncbi:MAG TPA: 30S ribosome-binding factor RbfA [bacterium]|nr:30S ribosome-binding factor RbfA [bacterium]